VECRVLLVRAGSCDERVQGVLFGVVGVNAQSVGKVVVSRSVCLVVESLQVTYARACSGFWGVKAADS
jgi:hypothetical protein